jgi:predicted dehydrogenase
METIRFGVLGAAKIVPAALVKPARANPHVEVAAVAARDRDRAAAFASKHHIPRVLGTYDELVADPGIDAVYIPLPNGLHGRWMLRAIEAGKHVLCEKPFTANAVEARAVADAAAASPHVVVMEAFHWRYHRMAARLVEVAHGGSAGPIGELRHVEASICFPLVDRRDIRYQLDLAGGALMDAGCYAVNIVRALAGTEPEVVSASAKLLSPGVDRALRGRLAFPGGVTGAVTASMLSRTLLSLRVRVLGARGAMTAFNPLMPRALGSITIRRDTGQRIVEQPSRTSTYGHQLAAFVAAVRDGRPFPSTAEDAVRNLAVIDALYRAAGLPVRQPTGAPTSAEATA